MNALLGQLLTLRSLRRHPRASRDEIATFRNTQLRRLIAHAYGNVPYYRRLFDTAGLKPHDVQSVADLSAVPITTKQDLQSIPMEETVARGVDPNRLLIRRTGGSSGRPLAVRRTWLEERVLNRLRARAMRDYGLRTSDRVAAVIPLQPMPHDRQWPVRILRAVGLYRLAWIDCTRPPEEIVQALRRYEPDGLAGYAGVLRQIARVLACEDRGSIHPRVVAAAEVQTPLMRQQIAAGFDAPVFDTYGSHEFNLIAWECRETGAYHVCDDGLVVEIVEDGRHINSGERGEVIATNLHSFAMPLIRFRLGDIVTRGDDTCKCGQPFSTIQRIIGRTSDTISLPDGRRIHPFDILEALPNRSLWIRAQQIVQQAGTRLLLRIESPAPPSRDELAGMRASVRALLGPDVEFEIQLVDEIQSEPSGKFRLFAAPAHHPRDVRVAEWRRA